MNEEQIADIWMMFKEYCDKKQINVIAEKYIDLLADYWISDQSFKEAIGSDIDLDNAISYYLDIDNDSEYEDDEWDE